MFGRRARDLEVRLDAVEVEVQPARQLVDDALSGTPEERVRFLANRVSDELRQEIETLTADVARLKTLRGEAESALYKLQAALRGERAAPWPVTLNHVYQADVPGYVSVWFDSGRTDKIDILVGDEDPPTLCVGNLNTTNDINSYVGTIVRPGEYWLLQSKQGERSGVLSMFTPLL